MKEFAGKFKKIILAFTLALTACFMFTGCSGPEPVYTIQNYKALISDIPQYYIFKYCEPPAIEGFNALTNIDFDYARPFEGEGTFVLSDSKKFVLFKNGIAKLSHDLPDGGIRDGKYVYSSGALKGLKALDGKIIIPAIYDSVMFDGNSALCALNDESYIFYGGVLTGKIKTDPVLLICDNVLKISESFFDFKLEPLLLNGHTVFELFDDNAFLIMENYKFGLIDINGAIIAPPEYDSVLSYVNGFATLKKGGKTYVIKDGGETVIDASELEIVSYDGDFAVVKNGDVFSVFDSSLENKLSDGFFSIYKSRVYFGEFIYDPYGFYPLHSLKLGAGFLNGYKNLKFFDGFFIAQSSENETYTVFDKSLNILIDGLTSAEYSENILCISKSGKYYFYTK